MTTFPDIIVIILAGGKGKRMESELPKVMHRLAGKPIIRHVTDTLQSLGFAGIVMVVGYGRELLFDEYRDEEIELAVQEKQLGTGDAVKAAAAHFADFSGDVLIVLGDVPLLRRESIVRLIEEHRRSAVAATVLTSILDNPGGYGRIVCGADGLVKKIVEDADASSEELRIKEINTGIMIFDAGSLRIALDKIDCNNTQGEYYLTDAVRVLLDMGKRTGAVTLADYREALGINSIEQLQNMEEMFSAIKNIDNKLSES